MANISLEADEGQAGCRQPPATPPSVVAVVSPFRPTKSKLPTQPAADVVAERERVAVEHPQHADDAECCRSHHHHVEDALGADHAAVEERQARGHEQHERGAGQDPGGVAVSWVSRGFLLRGPGSVQEVGRGGLPSDAPKVSGVYPSLRSGYGLVTWRRRVQPVLARRNTRTAAKVAMKAPNPPEARAGTAGSRTGTRRPRRRQHPRAPPPGPGAGRPAHGLRVAVRLQRPARLVAEHAFDLGEQPLGLAGPSPGVRRQPRLHRASPAAALQRAARAPPLYSGGVAEQRVDERLRVERRQVVGALAQADELDRHPRARAAPRRRCRPWRCRRAWSARCP